MVRSRVADFPAAPPTARPSWYEALETFLEACRVSGQSPTSVQSKVDSLGLFSRHCAAHGVDPLEAGTDFIQGWLAQQRSALSINTVRVRYMALRVLYRYARRRGWITHDPTDEIPAPQQAFTPIQPYSDTDLRAMWASLDGNKRAAALLAILLGGSLRASEACSMQVEDVDWEEGLIRVYGKGGKWRLCAPGPIAMMRLRAYVGERMEGPVFVGQRGPLTRHGVGRIIKKLGLDSGVLGAHPHRFRHTFGDSFLRRGGSASDLQVIFGHSSSATTKRYVAWNAMDRAVKAQRAFNPMVMLLEETADG